MVNCTLMNAILAKHQKNIIRKQISSQYYFKRYFSAWFTKLKARTVATSKQFEKSALFLLLARKNCAFTYRSCWKPQLGIVVTNPAPAFLVQVQFKSSSAGFWHNFPKSVTDLSLTLRGTWNKQSHINKGCLTTEIPAKLNRLWVWMRRQYTHRKCATCCSSPLSN